MLRQENRGTIPKIKVIKAPYREAFVDLPVNKRSKSTTSAESPPFKRRLPSNQVVWRTTATNEEVFVDAKEYFDWLGHNVANLSPIQRRPVSASTYIVNDVTHAIQQPAVKKTLINRSNKKISSINYDLFVKDVFYSYYLQDTIKHFLKVEWKRVVKPGYLKSDPVGVKNRKLILNWLQQLHQNASMGPTVFLTAVRLYDCMIATNQAPAYLHQLIAMAILWSVNKLDTGSTMGATKLLKCSGCTSYTPEELLQMEIKMLVIFDCNYLLPDPITFVCYYLRLLRQDFNFKVLAACASFILESFALHPDFSLFPPSFQAAAATYLSVRTIDPHFSHWDVLLQHYPGYYNSQEIQSLKILMAHAVKEQQTPNCPCTAAYSKYSTPEYGSVSVIYSDYLANDEEFY